MSGLSAGLSVNSLNKPSIFELVASQSLDATFHPALHRVATVRKIFHILIYIIKN